MPNTAAWSAEATLMERAERSLYRNVGVAVSVFAVAGVGASLAQSLDPPPFGASPSTAATTPATGWAARAANLEERFRETETWTFFHALADLPDDMRNALARVAGSEVVGPGEDLDLTDVVEYPGRAQHLYTATTPELGVIVWYTGGNALVPHAVLYDRREHIACRYTFGQQGTMGAGVVPLRSRLRAWIDWYGMRGNGCEYLAKSFFD